MTRYLHFATCLIATLCAEVAFAQVTSTQRDASNQDSNSRSTVAYVYVSGGSLGKREINAFTTASNGKLTPGPGSPFRAQVEYAMGLNEKYLFATDGVYIYSFSIASDGALKQVASINAQQYNGGNGCGPEALFLDHTGATLYDLDICTNNAYQSFAISDSTGELTYLGVSDSSNWFYDPLSFIGNNVYAYGADCLGDMYWTIFGFQRNNDGTLTGLDINPSVPKAKYGDFYCPNLTAADAKNHVAISLQAVNGNFQPDGLPQLASYTADSLGNVSTKNTRSNMPETAVQNIIDMRVSPSSKLLAVGGAWGLQVFHFNGSKPITHYTELLINDEVDQLYWDNDNHLYAVSQPAGKLFVFTVTPTSVTQAPDSPHKITNPAHIIVLPKK
jgi:hypothetical protein